MTKYLLEIGTEELPYKFIGSALKQLKESFSASLKGNRLEFTDIKTYGTPRRLCIIVENLSESQPELIKEIKGPPAKIAFDENGKLTQAGIGFAKKQGLDANDLTKKTINNTEYLWASIKEHGKLTKEVLKQLVPELVLKLQGPYFMRWADQEIKFSRPIRWLVSIFDGQEVKINIGNVESGKESMGHRFSVPNKIAIQNPDTNQDEMYKVKVIVDKEKKQQEIKKQIHEAAKSKGGTAKINPDLLEEVTNLVEWPTPVIGSFDEKYLEITQEVIVSVLAYHQRYFPVYDQQDNLLNYFITIANHDETNLENIRKGNEKVVKARLDDAIFFYKEDTKKPLESKVEELKGVTFQKGLGTVYDKMLRIQEITGFISNELGLNGDVKEKIQRTAYLCKADLVTNLVREFTELQGIIGTDYAKLAGEDELVSIGIKEHYMPVSADGELASNRIGQVVGIADKIDTICGVFALGKNPTGSADPLGLRRAVLGIINTLINKNICLDLSKVINKAVSVQPVDFESKDEIEAIEKNPDKPFIKNKNKLIKDIKEFIVQRFRILLNEKYKYDLVDAVLEVKDPLENIDDVLTRLQIISELVKKDFYKIFHESANRTQRIIKGQAITGIPDESMLKEEAEKKLWEKINTIDEEKDYSKLVKKLENATPFIEEFFDKVLVMDKDEQIKQNRLNLLENLNKKFMRIADFSKIVF